MEPNFCHSTGNNLDDALRHHFDSLTLAAEVLDELEVLAFTIQKQEQNQPLERRDRRTETLARLAGHLAHESLADFEAYAREVRQKIEATNNQPAGPGYVPGAVKALVDRVAWLYSGATIDGPPLELRITGHDVYLAKQAKAALGGSDER